jgi:Spy/CpxP family protein refolding chaperone
MIQLTKFRTALMLCSFLSLPMIVLGTAMLPAPALAGGERYIKMADELKFTAEQREKLKKIQDEFHKTLPEKRKAMEAAREELQKALRGSGTADEVRKKFDELERRQTDFARSRFEKILSVRALLSPEQREKFNAYDDRGPDRHHDRKHENDLKRGAEASK